MLGKVWFHTTEQEDGRASGTRSSSTGRPPATSITMLQIPQAILDAVPEGPLTRPAQSALELLRDPARTAMSIVTLAEDLPSNEAIELVAQGHREARHHRSARSSSTRSIRRASSPASRRARSPPCPRTSTTTALQPLVTAARTAQRRRELNDRYLERLRTRAAGAAGAACRTCSPPTSGPRPSKIWRLASSRNWRRSRKRISCEAECARLSWRRCSF